MQTLPNRQPSSCLSVFQPGLPVLRCKDHPTLGHAANCALSCGSPAAREPDALGSVWPQRGRSALSGAAENASDFSSSWPGCFCGVRQPSRYETPLSYDEVAHGVRVGVILPDAQVHG